MQILSILLLPTGDSLLTQSSNYGPACPSLVPCSRPCLASSYKYNLPYWDYFVSMATLWPGIFVQLLHDQNPPLHERRSK